MDACHPFDGMPPRRRGGKGERGAELGGIDHIGALPDDVLHRILGLLPAHEAVRTGVLARRWRHLWKSATGMCIACGDLGEPAPAPAPASVKKVQDFVERLLLLRRDSPLDTCKLMFSRFDEEDMPLINLWIRQVLMCKVQELILNIYRFCGDDVLGLELDELPLISPYLTRLELCNLKLNDGFLDFSNCPVLKELEIHSCDLANAKMISSESLEYLDINGDCYFNLCSRTCVYAPNLVSLDLEVRESENRTPMLERMPSLVDAVVTIRYSVYDICMHTKFGDCDDEDCFSCYGVDGDTNNCLLLHGLSEAENLTLICDIDMFIFRRDLKWCPVFNNLKTLLLNEYWCVPTDFSALSYMIEHSPVLEKLTLAISSEGPKSKVIMKGSPDPTERSAISEHFKIVEVRCQVVNDIVLNVLKFLKKLNIHSYKFEFDE